MIAPIPRAVKQPNADVDAPVGAQSSVPESKEDRPSASVCPERESNSKTPAAPDSLYFLK